MNSIVVARASCTMACGTRGAYMHVFVHACFSSPIPHPLNRVQGCTAHGTRYSLGNLPRYPSFATHHASRRLAWSAVG